MAAPQIPLYSGEIPNRNTQSASEFSDAADTTMNYFLTVPEEYNSLSEFINTAAEVCNGVENYHGYWSGLSGGYSLGISVQHNDSVWLLNVDTTDITATEPSDANTDWTKLASFAQQLQNTADIAQNTADIAQNTADISNAQFSEYRSDRVYCCGDVCFTEDGNGKKTFWEWYSNVESLAGKDPLDAANRQAGWSDETKPFYWTPYKKARAGATLWPWMSMTFPEGTLNVIGNSVPAVVFWRLAETFPEFINADTAMIDFPDTCGEFFRVLDQGRGINAGRVFSSLQLDAFQGHKHMEVNPVGYGGGWGDQNSHIGTSEPQSAGTYDAGYGTPRISTETRPRNLAFPILVEI